MESADGRAVMGAPWPATKELPAYQCVELHVKDNLEHYRAYFMSSTAHREHLAGEWHTKLNMFQRCARVDGWVRVIVGGTGMVRGRVRVRVGVMVELGFVFG